MNNQPPAMSLFGEAPEYHLRLPLSGRKQAAIFCPGASLNNLTRDTFDAIRNNADTWAVNQVQWHPYIVPDYWHFEPMSQMVPVSSVLFGGEDVLGPMDFGASQVKEFMENPLDVSVGVTFKDSGADEGAVFSVATVAYEVTPPCTDTVHC